MRLAPDAELCGQTSLLFQAVFLRPASLSWPLRAPRTRPALTLAWDPSSDPNVAGYRLYFGNQPGVYTQSVDVGKVGAYQINGLTNGAPYYFVVKAYNSAGILSAPSIEVSRRVGVPFAVRTWFRRGW